jgi:hypothetical protein
MHDGPQGGGDGAVHGDAMHSDGAPVAAPSATASATSSAGRQPALPALLTALGVLSAVAAAM